MWIKIKAKLATKILLLFNTMFAKTFLLVAVIASLSHAMQVF
jgi:hypothetical protein